MDLERIKELVKLIEDSSLSEFSLKEGEDEITLKKASNGTAPAVAAAQQEVKKELVEEEESEDDSYIISPMVGTFYNSPSPEAPSFVNVGDVVKAGQTVCIIEAMKLMNEIECEYDAEILSIIASNEQKVEYGQPLFKVKKI